jgi:hypothetical protein
MTRPTGFLHPSRPVASKNLSNAFLEPRLFPGLRQGKEAAKRQLIFCDKTFVQKESKEPKCLSRAS